MVSTYKLNTDELTSDFILTLQKSYPKKNVKILVRETADETEYLLGTPANRSHLLQVIDDIENGKNLVSIPAEVFLK
jgi:hypothetical protein